MRLFTFIPFGTSHAYPLRITPFRRKKKERHMSQEILNLIAKLNLELSNEEKQITQETLAHEELAKKLETIRLY
jgi:hypothetical protein